MIKNLLLCLSFICVTALSLTAQNTVGLLSYVPWKSYDGYNLLYPHNQPNVYLLNNCGEIVHVWEDDDNFRPGNTAYLLPDGRLVKTKRNADISGDPIWAGGGGATVEIRDWDNNLEWSFTRNDEFERLHHDIAITEDNTILMIVWENKTEAEAIQAGRDPNLLPDGELWPDKIIEVDPATDEIIWEWHVWDHLIQDIDDTKDNYGVVEDHPEKVDINYDTSDGADDWMHSNALDYHQANNQVILSVPTFSEVWVIDHSTDTQEAAGSTGGLGGVGGDLMYRFGNPLAYRKGTVEDQILFYQHDIHWIDDFIEQVDPYYDKMAVFNNRVGADFSTAEIFTAPFDMYEWSYFQDNGLWGPTTTDLTLSHPNPQAMYSTGLSSIQYLPNGNFLLTSGRWGYSFELTPDNNIVWEYVTPLVAGVPASQGDTLSINNNLTFRMKRFPPDYSAFDGKDLTPMGYLEENPVTDFCSQILPVAELMDDYKMKVYPNPANEMITIEWDGGVYVDIEVFDMLGRQVIEPMSLSGGRKYLNTSDWQVGIYYIRINQTETVKVAINR